MFFYIKCVLFVLVLSISGEISAQEKRDSVRIYFHQGKVNIDTCLLDNGNEMERFAKICSALNDSVRLMINPVRDTVYIHTRDTLCIRDTVTVIAPVKKRLFCMAVKTNLLYDAVLIPDIGVEFCLGKNWSVAGNWMYAWWKSDRKHNYWRIYGGDVELRRWFGRRAVEKPFSGHHVGLYGQIVTYDFELGGKGYLGDKWSYGGGVAYGYSLPVGHRFNVDFTLGIGYLGGSYKEYIPLDGHYVWQTTKNRRWFGPTKAGISLVWLIGRGNYSRKKGGRQ